MPQHDPGFDPNRRVHVLLDDREWREDWPRGYEDDLVLTPDGIYVVRREDLMTTLRPARLADVLRLLGRCARAIGEGAVQLTARIPFPLVLQAAAFFRAVWEEERREDVLLLYYHEEEQRYALAHPPIRRASESRVDYHMPATPEGVVRMGSLHSHGDFSPRHYSATDRQDDRKSPGVHIVIGNVLRACPSIVCYCHDGVWEFPVNPADLFDFSPWPDYPEAWRMEPAEPAERRPSDVL